MKRVVEGVGGKVEMNSEVYDDHVMFSDTIEFGGHSVVVPLRELRQFVADLDKEGNSE